MARTTTQMARVRAVLEEGPSTAPEIAAETGLSLKHCSAYLCALVKSGLAVKTGRVATTGACPHCGQKKVGARAYIYGLVGQVS